MIKKLLAAVLVVFIIGGVVFGAALFDADQQFCPFGTPIDHDGNGIPENCFVTGDGE